MKSVALAIDETSPSGIAGAIARLISSGDLAPGDRLPTVRELAADLGVSPATVSHAWQALAGVGLIVSRGRSGSFVRAARTAWIPPRSRNLADQPLARLDLSTGTPDPLLLPDLGPALSRVSSRAGTASYLDSPVLPELETLLRASWPYEVEAVTVVDGAMDAISRSLDLVLRFGSRVVVETPGFPPVFDLLEHLGIERLPVELDERGIRPDSLAAALKLSPAAIVLQPRTHNPAGVSMTAERAEELARVIRSSRFAEDTVVIEDDHSGAISAVPEVSLGTFLPERVVHIRSFSKSHGPDLRIAAVGGPRALIDRLVARRLLGPGWTPRMLQRILYDLLTSANTIDQISDARRVYRGRQKALSDALAAHGYAATLPDGINLWMRVEDERAAVVQLAAAGIRVAAGTPFLTAPDGQFIRITAGLVRDDFDAVGALLAAAARA
ncbi:DNA-binding transcriptional MocR family regulator [Glaciihabitans tibetensis]|uniref:DNA-binding transcriptional MocR family regulator n=1 Tax=Glaciihabitans tibetensis TaxID=1266600 RepID=A0A2T0VI94_9MICO|nr:aminotransferase class I/II-fold pyridoxal phosphate-dependent enzyme [Glaciihabitans tibetensis]PRY69903.1 DNA-binding transcriptional MocR family regulator [Glaciihabitans tibetensis]